MLFFTRSENTPISELSADEATALVQEDGYFGIDKTSQRIIDFVIKGAGEHQLKRIIKDFTGFELDDNYISSDLNVLPYPALDLQNEIAYAPILTSRGCPFSCDYCASSYLEPEFRQRSPENVFKEILSQ